MTRVILAIVFVSSMLTFAGCGKNDSSSEEKIHITVLDRPEHPQGEPREIRRPFDPDVSESSRQPLPDQLEKNRKHEGMLEPRDEFNAGHDLNWRPDPSEIEIIERADLRGIVKDMLQHDPHLRMLAKDGNRESAMDYIATEYPDILDDIVASTNIRDSHAVGFLISALICQKQPRKQQRDRRDLPKNDRMRSKNRDF